MKVIKLGEFIDYNEDITNIEVEAFNYYLALEYANAMEEENFEILGNFSFNLLEKICYWLGFFSREEDIKLLNEIKNGTLITNKNRTFIDAIYINKKGDFAEAYLNMGLKSPKLVLTIILENLINHHSANIGNEDFKQEDYEKLFNELYDLIETEYNNSSDKQAFLYLINNNYNRVKCYKLYKKIPASDKYNWVKDLVKYKKEKSLLKMKSYNI